MPPNTNWGRRPGVWTRVRDWEMQIVIRCVHKYSGTNIGSRIKVKAKFVCGRQILFLLIIIKEKWLCLNTLYKLIA